MPAPVHSLKLQVTSTGVAQAVSSLDKLAAAATHVSAAYTTMRSVVVGTTRDIAAASAVTVAGAKATSASAAATVSAAAAKATETAATTANTTAKVVGAAASRRSAVATTQMGSATIFGVGATKSATVAMYAFRRSLLSLITPILLVLGPLGLMFQQFKATKSLQTFQAQLKTATGSIEGAAEALEALKDFAMETPFELEKSLEAFVKLTNRGLTPSEAAMRSYGNTASALGFDLTQMIEAVADATTFEFERLKEFGINAKSQGDKVSFTFQGTTKTIGRNAQEIEGYLMSLGEVNFAGAMEERMKTVGGLASNLKDTWNEMFRTFSEAGAGGGIASFLSGATSTLKRFVSVMKSGELSSTVESWTVAWKDAATDITRGLTYIGALLKTEAASWGVDLEGAWGPAIRGAKMLPAIFRAGVKWAGIELGSLVTWAAAAGTGMADVFVLAFDSILAAAVTLGKGMAQAMNPFSEISAKELGAEAIAKATAQLAAGAKEATDKWALMHTTMAIAGEARQEEMAIVLAEFDKTGKAVDAATSKSAALKEAYLAEAAALKAAREGSDRTGKFKIVVEGDPINASELTELREKLLEERELEDYEFTLRSERAQEFFDEEQEFLTRALGAKQLLEAEYQTASQESWRKYSATLTKIQQDEAKARARTQLQALTGAGQVASGLRNLAEEGSSARQVLFGIEKGMAVAQAIVFTNLAAVRAMAELGPIAGPPAAASITSWGYANAAIIAATAVSDASSGNFADGGIVGGSSFSGDNVVANVNSGEMILNSSQQKNLFDNANGRGSKGSSGTIVHVNNYGNDEVEVTESRLGDQKLIEIAVRTTKAEINAEIRSGSGDHERALQSRDRRVG